MKVIFKYLFQSFGMVFVSCLISARHHKLIGHIGDVTSDSGHLGGRFQCRLLEPVLCRYGLRVAAEACDAIVGAHPPLGLGGCVVELHSGQPMPETAKERFAPRCALNLNYHIFDSTIL